MPNVMLCLRGGCNLKAGHRGRCNIFPSDPINKLPREIINKLNKTKQTRGAQPYGRVQWQNRVNRSNKVVIPLRFRESVPPEGKFENGYVIMVRPGEIIDEKTNDIRKDFPKNIIIGENAFIFYDNRHDWDKFPPADYGWKPRRLMLNGNEIDTRKNDAIDVGDYLARIPGTTSEDKDAIVEGPPQGIRFYEYASSRDIWLTTMQLAYLATKTEGLDKEIDVNQSFNHLDSICEYYNLNDIKKLEEIRVLKDNMACCPLCLEPIRASELMDRAKQVEGREVVDLTVTEANLFHIKDIRPGEYNHRVYLLGWGHYHCNTVARDHGIEETLRWMRHVLENNKMI